MAHVERPLPFPLVSIAPSRLTAIDMLQRLLGQGTTVDQLRQGLTESTRTARGIAHRVASASAREDATFAQTLEEAQAAQAGEAVDVEKEMVALAEEQLRFQATANLLQKVYGQIRSSIREG